MTDKKPEAIIAGGGIGGLCAALCFRRRGYRVQVFEQVEQFGEVGAGIQLSPNAMQVLSWLGLEAELEAVACEPEQGSLRHHRSGRVMWRQPLIGVCQQRYGAKYLHIHRGDLIEVLQRAVQNAGVDLQLGRSVTGYWQDGERVQVLCGDDGYSADLLIGADGIHSKVREQMFGAEQACFTGRVAWRGLVPAKRLPVELLPMHAHVWLGPGQHLVAYYLRGGEVLNFVAVQERDVWAEENWMQTGNLQEMRSAFANWDPVVQTILNECDQCHLWGLFDRDPLPRWHEGRVVLLGDACHPMLPFMAQGGAMAIEDGFVLAREVEVRSVSEALMNYEVQRQPRASLLQRLSRSNARLFHQRNWLTRSVRRAVLTVLDIGRVRAGPLDRVCSLDVTVGK